MTTDGGPRYATASSETSRWWTALIGGAVVLLVSLVVCIAIGASITGWVAAAAMWALSSALSITSRSLGEGAQPNTALALAAVSMFARIGILLVVPMWIGGSAEIGEATVGLGQPDAAVVALVIYAIAFSTDIFVRLSLDARRQQTYRTLHESSEDT